MSGCVLYRVSGRIGSQTNLSWQLVSPDTAFKEVDLHWWRSLEALGLFSGDISVIQHFPSWLSWAKHKAEVSAWSRQTASRGMVPAEKNAYEITDSVYPSAIERRQLSETLRKSQASSRDDKGIAIDLHPEIGDETDLTLPAETVIPTEPMMLWPLLSGRLLTLQETEEALKELADSVQFDAFGKIILRQGEHALPDQSDPGSLNFLPFMQLCYLQGCMDWTPSMTSTATSGLFDVKAILNRRHKDSTVTLQCSRCHSQEVVRVSCARCGEEECAYCTHCLSLGRLFACQPLLAWHPAPLPKTLTPVQPLTCHWTGTLSAWQEEASAALCNFVRKETEVTVQQWEKGAVHKVKDMSVGAADHFLVWAVCGAGKTEMLFDMLSEVLSANQRVLITAPRRDVILELAPRLCAAFPDVAISALYGGSPKRFRPAQLVLATTHQVLRFKEAFDLIIVDEEDAFPYHFDPMLPFAVERARKSSGRTIYLSATPRPALRKQAERGRLPHVLVPRRYHGHPLPVPQIKPVGNWRKKIEKGEVIGPLQDYLSHLRESGRFGYLFLPHVSDIEKVHQYVQQVLLPLLHTDAEQPFTVEGVHAKHPQRDQIVRRFRAHEIRLLLTTTILERGVTIPYSDVVILGSDDQVFDQAALIQVAGRVGRSADDPRGEVIFLPEIRTRAQLKAQREIILWNRMKL